MENRVRNESTCPLGNNQKTVTPPSPQLKGYAELYGKKGQKGEGYSGYQRQCSRGFTEALLPMHQRSAQKKKTALVLGCKKGTLPTSASAEKGTPAAASEQLPCRRGLCPVQPQEVAQRQKNQHLTTWHTEEGGESKGFQSETFFF